MTRLQIAALVSATAAAGLTAWLVFGRAESGISPDVDFEPTSVAPLTPLPEEPFELSPPRALGGRAEFVAVLFVDGLSEGVFLEQLDTGQLPAIKRLMASRPFVLGSASGTFPTSTAPAIPELLTGTWSHRQFGGPDKIHAFDRRGGRLLRYEVQGKAWDSNRPTLFDLVTAGGGTALSYFEGYFPGASLNVHDELVYLLDIAEDKVRAERIGDYDARMVRDFSTRLHAAGRAPNLAFLRLGAVDTAGHFYGPSSPQYAAALRSVDERVGELLHQLELARLPDGATLLERTHVVICSDHGMSDTREHLDLDAVLAELGFNPWATSDPTAVVTTLIDEQGAADHDAVAVPGGSNISAIYLRRRVGGLLTWSKSVPAADLTAYPTAAGGVDIVSALTAREGVELVIYPRGEDALRVERAAGGATLWRALAPDGSWRLAYQPDDPAADPFGYCPSEVCCASEEAPEEGCYLSLEALDRATGAAPIPSAPFLLFKAFSGPPLTRQDLLVTAAGGWGFMADMGGDHGALRPELLRVPLLISGPRVDPEGALEGARLIDLFPTVLELVGLGGVYPAEMVDGRALEVLTAATGDSG